MPTLNREYQRAYRAANLEKLQTRERENARRYRLEHPSKVKEAAARCRQKNKAGLRDRHLRRKYGLSSAEYEQMLVAQSGLCAICREPETYVGRHGTPKLAVDHDHQTGVVRGLLCWNCNVTIGKMGDDPKLLRAAADYLERTAPI